MPRQQTWEEWRDSTTQLRLWRLNAGLSQPELARLLGVDTQTVWRWEHGSRSIPPFLHLALEALTERLLTGRSPLASN